MELSIQVPPFSTQVPPFSTQDGTEKEVRVVVKKRSREQFTREEDILLIQSWLNVSKDPIVGVDQKAASFWLRIAASYNQYRRQLREKLGGQLKCRWHRINDMVQKFVGCYKIALKGKKSGTSETDVMADANAIFAQDQVGHHRRTQIQLQVMSLTHHHQWDKKQQKGRVRHQKFQMQRKMQRIKEQ
ncbi:unnamed protein product [Lathyrus sativus]|nr:unnamed protein product [Lathyrus sativus]